MQRTQGVDKECLGVAGDYDSTPKAPYPAGTAPENQGGFIPNGVHADGAEGPLGLCTERESRMGERIIGYP
jgi:hypothetical protein